MAQQIEVNVAVLPLLNFHFSWRRHWLLIPLGTAVLILAHFVALVFRVEPAVSLWFPPAGIAIALTLWFGPIGILLAGIASICVAPVWGNDGWTQLLGITDMSEPLVAWFLYRRGWQGSLVLASWRDAIAFTISAPLLGCLTSAVVGSFAIAAVGNMPMTDLPKAVSSWWLGNAIGTMAIVPPALLLLTPVWRRWGWLPTEDAAATPRLPRLQGQVLAILAFCTAIAILSVIQTRWGSLAYQQIALLSFIPVLWAATRYGVAGGALTSSFCVLVTVTAYMLIYPSALTQSSFPIAPEVLHIHKLNLLVQCGVGLLVGRAVSDRFLSQAALAAEQIRAAEYQTRAELSEQLLQLNNSLTQANLRLEASSREKDALLQREQRAREQLLESEERLRTALDAMLDCVSIQSAIRDNRGKILDFRFEYINAAACTSNQMSREAHLGRSLCELFPAHREAGLFEAYCRVVETGEPLVRESLSYEDIYGQQRLRRAYDIRAAKLGDGFIASWRDVTNRRQAEEALRQSEARFTKLADNVPGVIYQYRHSAAGAETFTYISPGCRALYELEPSAVQEDASLMWRVVHPEDLEGLRQSFSASAPTGQQWQWEWRILLPSGKLKWIQGVARSERQPDGALLWDGLLLDITERKQIEAVRAQLLAREQEVRRQAEAANRMKDEFLAIVSHELRSPLNAILGWSRLLRTRQLDDSKTKQALEVIDRNAKAQTQLIEDLLDISRIIRGKVRLYRQPLNLSDVAAAALDTVRPTADAKQIRLSLIQPDAVVQVSGDPDRLQQIVWNLLSNAIKFTSEGGEVSLTICCRHDRASSACLQVSDTGKGISPEFLPYVFDRFRQADSSTTRSHGGLGLGLAIVRNLVELHGGSIEVDSPGEGKGAVFTVRLPLLKDASEASAVIGPSEAHTDDRSGLSPLAPASVSLQGVGVLVVDDEPDAREFLTVVLEQAGAAVRAAASAAEALSLLAESPQILVSDISMPGEDGYTLIRKIRALPATAGGQIPAAALTAYAREEDRLRAIAAGFHLHIAKPIDPAELVAAVATLANLGQHHETR